jgi:hypothetical protein
MGDWGFWQAVFGLLGWLGLDAKKVLIMTRDAGIWGLASVASLWILYRAWNRSFFLVLFVGAVAGMTVVGTVRKLTDSTKSPATVGTPPAQAPPSPPASGNAVTEPRGVGILLEGEGVEGNRFDGVTLEGFGSGIEVKNGPKGNTFKDVRAKRHSSW